MEVRALAIPDVLLLTPPLYTDARGSFMESFNVAQFTAAVGQAVHFVQDNHSHSRHKVLRGLHYQVEQAQGKLVRVVQGEIWDVAVDLRRGSPHFGRWVGTTLSAANRAQVWVPEGFAHGFVVLSASADVLYKTTAYWAPQHERCIAWDDAQLAIDWPIVDPLLGPRDRAATPFAAAATYP